MHSRVLAIASLIALAGCHFQADPPSEAPGNVQVIAGDGQVVVTWDQQPELTYWIFYQPGSSVVPATPGVPLIFNAVSPRVVTGLVNATQYAFIMNATMDDSKAGPSSPVMLQTPKLAGDTWSSGAALTTANLNGIAFNGSRLVVVGDSATTATIFAGDYNYTSTTPRGVTAWMSPTSLPAGFPTTTNFSAVTFSNQFVALGIDGSILTSSDGLTWTSPGTIPTAGAIVNGIAFGAGVYVAVGTGGSIFTSSDLVIWTQVANAGSALHSVSFLNGGFIVTGAGGTLLTSTNGSTWTPGQGFTTASALRGAAFRSAPTALYVVVGDAGTVVTSPDGTHWTANTLAGAPNLRSVTSGGALGTRFLAVGLGGAVVFSDDGTNWSSPSMPPDPVALARVIFTPAMYVAVGAAGANAFAK